MIAEKLSIRFDIDKIKTYFNENVKSFDPVWQNSMFGGWSLLSTSGDYKDGFQQGHIYFENGHFNYEKANRECGFTWPKMHINPTQVGNGYILDVINEIKQLGLKPHRARWTIITPGGATSWHRDMADHLYGVRLHIPVITNPDCAFETDEGSFHMIADGSCYLVAVNKMHKAYNHGKEDRIHIIMDVIDDVGISKFHKMEKI